MATERAPRRIVISTTDEVIDLLERLRLTGLYGASREDVAEELIRRGLVAEVGNVIAWRRRRKRS